MSHPGACVFVAGCVWNGAVWRGPLSDVVAGGFSDSGRVGAHSPGRREREREKRKVMLCSQSCGDSVSAQGLEHEEYWILELLSWTVEQELYSTSG